MTGANMVFTDNVYELSAARRLALSEDPSQPALVRPDSPSDVVWDPWVEVQRTGSSGLGLTEVSVKAHGFIYTNNPIFNHGDYRLQIRQQVAPQTFVLLRYRYVPNMFLGSNIERQSGNRTMQEERVTSHIWRMQLERNLGERWTVLLVGRYGLRFYNQPFSERDTTFYTIGPRVEFRATSWFTVTLDYLYERGLADGREEPQFKDDISYRQQFVSLRTLFQLTQPLSLDLIYVFRSKQFTTEITGDPLQGNVDYLHQGTVALHYDLTAAARVTVGFQRTQRTASAVGRDFFSDNASLGLEYRF